MTELFISGPETGSLLVLAHGAGAPATSPFMTLIAELLETRDVGTVRFEFAYMAARRTDGKRRPPPKAETMIGEYTAAVGLIQSRYPGRALIIGGKSMGGRIASMAADELYRARRICGLICLGYPFHPIGKPEHTRTAHLASLSCPALIVQGERDPFGNRDEVGSYELSEHIELHWAADGDHDLGPRGGMGYTRRGNLEAAAEVVARFLSTHAAI